MNYLFYNVFLFYAFVTGAFDFDVLVGLHTLWWMFYWFKKMIEWSD